jgi:transcription elongation factor Elf1
LCDYNSFQKGVFKKHIVIHCEKKCSACGEKYKRGSRIIRHIKNRKCWFCSIVFPCKTSWKKHIEDNHRDSLGHYKCPQCTKARIATFKTLLRLQTHISICHVDEKRLTCTICSKKLSSTSALRYHIQDVHTNASTKFSCDLCAYETSTIKTLKCHMKRHRIDGRTKRFTCDRCGHQVYSKNDMKLHLSRKHLTCCYCDKKLPCKPLFDRHCLEIHGAQTKSWPCETCKSIFPKACKLTEHQKRHRHGKFASKEVEEIKCTRCSKSYKTRRYYLCHLKNVHKIKEIRKCHICSVNFKKARSTLRD